MDAIMLRSIPNKLANVPTPMGGLALGIASVLWCWENFMPLNGAAQLAGALIGGVLLLVLCAKFILHPALLRQDLAHPIVGSVAPTFAMGIMVVSVTVCRFSLTAGAVLWCLAVVLHLVFLLVFSVHRSRRMALHHLIPSWFVPPVGIIVAAVSVPPIAVLHSVALGLQYFGMLCYAVMLPLMLYRFIFTQGVVDAAKPTIAIMAAPASLSLAGYLTVSEHPSPLIVAVLLGIALLMTLLIYLAFFQLLRLPFSPGYAAFTFPMAIGATALFKATKQFANWGVSAKYVAQMQLLANIELLLASVIIAYVAMRYAYNYLPMPRRDFLRS
jgi:exfoliative toxin A/B